MTMDMGRLVADVTAAPPGSPALHWFDQIRALLLGHRPAAAARCL